MIFHAIDCHTPPLPAGYRADTPLLLRQYFRRALCCHFSFATITYCQLTFHLPPFRFRHFIASYYATPPQRYFMFSPLSFYAFDAAGWLAFAITLDYYALLAD